MPAATTAVAPAAPIELRVDATDIDHRRMQVHEVVPVAPGKVTLQYPHWIPGTHSPIGNVYRLAGLQIHAHGHAIDWERDPADVESFRVTVPAGVTMLELDFDHLSSMKDNDDNEIVHDMLDVNWRKLLLYPMGVRASDVMVEASVTLPAGWDYGTSLRPMHGGAVDAHAPTHLDFPAMSLEMLIDSPIISARLVRHYVVDPDPKHPVNLHVFANEAAQIDVSDAVLAQHTQLVRQALALFGARHYDHYDFLLVVDDPFGVKGGLEHHQSSENGVRRNYFVDWDKSAPRHALLPHEYVHSWNGKFRRPRDLWTPTYNDTPMQGSLLWVYEGLTNYWGEVLAARSGLMPPAVAHGMLASEAATALARAGHDWRNLQDTTNDPVMMTRGRGLDWIDWQRPVDYYPEGTLLWLSVDVKLRQLSGDRRSLDDFAKLFHGRDDGRISPELYDFNDIVRALDTVEHFDWARYLRERLDAHDANGLLDGIRNGGWRVSYAEKPNEFARMQDELNEETNLVDSLGISVSSKDGMLKRVLWGGPAFQAGLSIADTLVAVNSHVYRADLLKQTVTAAKGGTGPIQLMVKESDVYRTVSIPYADGLRYPVLERTDDPKNYLDEILAPK